MQLSDYELDDPETIEKIAGKLDGLIGEGFGELYESCMNTYRPFAYPKNSRRNRDERIRYHKMKALEKQKLVKLQNRGEILSITLTTVGRMEFLKMIIICQMMQFLMKICNRCIIQFLEIVSQKKK